MRREGRAGVLASLVGILTATAIVVPAYAWSGTAIGSVTCKSFETGPIVARGTQTNYSDSLFVRSGSNQGTKRYTYSYSVAVPSGARSASWAVGSMSADRAGAHCLGWGG